MSEQRETYADRVARQQRKLDRRLAELAVTHHEASLFRAVNYGALSSPSDLPRWAASDGYHLHGPATEADTQAALAAGLAKGWLRVIDDAALAEIAADLRRGRFAGPIYGYPPVGMVDFTPAGAALWQRICPRRGGDEAFAFTDVVHEKRAFYFRTRAAAAEEIGLLRAEDDVVAVSDSVPVGPWRAQWWRRFPDGYRVDIEQRRRWQGRCVGSTEECYLYMSAERADPSRLRHVLASHELGLGEWAALAEPEHGPLPSGERSGPRYPAAAVREYGETISEHEYCAGFERCLSMGWLKVLDQQAMEEMRFQLRDDTAILAVPRTAELRQDECYFTLDPLRRGDLVPFPRPDSERWGEVDFTAAGAAVYQAVLGEWLGPGWEGDLRVANGYYREEHRYCETEAGFRRIVPEYAAKGQVVRDTRVVPIGPWCVYWWDRFPDGYRTELQIGEP